MFFFLSIDFRRAGALVEEALKDVNAITGAWATAMEVTGKEIYQETENQAKTFPRRQCCGLTATATSSNVRKVFSFLCFFFVFLFLFFFSYFFFCRRLSYRLLTHCILCFSLFLFFLSHLAAQLLSQNGRPARMTSITASDWCCLTVARRGST